MGKTEVVEHCHLLSLSPHLLLKIGSVWPLSPRGKGCRTVAPKFQLATESPGGLWKYTSLGPFWASDSLGLGVGLNNLHF